MARPRTYQPNKQVAAVTPLRREEGDRRIPTSAKLLDIKDASHKLTEQFGSGYSVSAIRRWVQNGEWIQNWHYTRRGRMIKVYLPAVQEWVVSGGS